MDERTTIQLGDRVTDTVTQYTGVATAKAVYLSGHPRWLVESLDRTTGNTIEAWFDEQRLVRVSP